MHNVHCVMRKRVLCYYSAKYGAMIPRLLVDANGPVEIHSTGP